MRTPAHQGLTIHPNGTRCRVLLVSREGHGNKGCGKIRARRVRLDVQGGQGVSRVEVEHRYRTGLPGWVCRDSREVIQWNHLQAKVGITVGRGFHRSGLVCRICPQGSRDDQATACSHGRACLVYWQVFAALVHSGLTSILSHDPSVEQATSVPFHPGTGRQLPVLTLPWTTK